MKRRHFLMLIAGLATAVFPKKRSPFVMCDISADQLVGWDPALTGGSISAVNRYFIYDNRLWVYGTSVPGPVYFSKSGESNATKRKTALDS